MSDWRDLLGDRDIAPLIGAMSAVTTAALISVLFERGILALDDIDAVIARVREGGIADDDPAFTRLTASIADLLATLLKPPPEGRH